ncbi:MAG: trypsin-like peptidase domain-containing protein [Proteobacteria bacterium]|nr:trypsin-like peptidase domain-containing protein [Pseudomonadota bacterium]
MAFQLGNVCSCKRKSMTPSYQGFVIGNDDIVRVENSGIPESYRNSVEATGSIISMDATSKKNHYCTGALIAPAEGQILQRVIANAHCFAASADPQNALAPWACNDTRIIFGIKFDDLSKFRIGRCKAGSLRVDSKADIAIFDLAEPLDAGVIPFVISGENKPVGTLAYVVHHPVIDKNMVTPQGMNFKVPSSVLTQENCALQLKEELSRGGDDLFAYDLAHSCDIIAGSSGAPIISQATHEIIGLNWGGIEWGGNGSELKENRAISSGYLKAFVDNNTESYVSLNPPPSEVKNGGSIGAASRDTSETALRNGSSFFNGKGCSMFQSVSK